MYTILSGQWFCGATWWGQLAGSRCTTEYVSRVKEEVRPCVCLLHNLKIVLTLFGNQMAGFSAVPSVKSANKASFEVLRGRGSSLEGAAMASLCSYVKVTSGSSCPEQGTVRTSHHRVYPQWSRECVLPHNSHCPCLGGTWPKEKWKMFPKVCKYSLF